MFLNRFLSIEFGGGWTRTSGVVRRGIYSPLQLPLCDTPIGEKKLLAKGIEPSTVRLQGGCSTIELRQQKSGNAYNMGLFSSQDPNVAP